MKGLVASTLLVVALAAQSAHAQAPSPNPAADAALTEGRRLYDLQEWDKAIAKFKEAYTLREDAPALFNIAQSYRLKGDCAQAAAFYKTFKRKFPKEKNIAKVEKFISEMETCAKNQPTTGTTTTGTTGTTTTGTTGTTGTTTTGTTGTGAITTGTTTTGTGDTPPTGTTGTTTTGTTTTGTVPSGPVDKPASSGGGGLRIASYVALGAGGAGIIVGAVFGMKARGAANDAEGIGAGEMWNPSIQERGQRNARTATIGFAAGGALLVGGAVMFFLSRPSASEKSSSVSLVPSTEGAQLVWGGSF